MALRGHYLAAAGMFLRVLLGSCGAQYAPGTLEMEMNGKAQMASLNTNVTIPCILCEHTSVTLNISLIGVRWFLRRADSDKEDKVFEYNGGKQTQFRPGASISLSRLKKGNASLFLPFIQLQEGGEYRCEIIIPPTKEERTSRVDVVAQPQITNKKVISSTQSPDVENTENTEETSKIPSRNNDGTFSATDSRTSSQSTVTPKTQSISLQSGTVPIVTGHGKDYFVYMVIFVILLLFRLFEVM